MPRRKPAPPHPAPLRAFAVGEKIVRYSTVWGTAFAFEVTALSGEHLVLQRPDGATAVEAWKVANHVGPDAYSSCGSYYLTEAAARALGLL